MEMCNWSVTLSPRNAVIITRVDPDPHAILVRLHQACTAAGGQASAIPEIKVNCNAMGVTIKTEVLNMPTCVGKDCPGDIAANGELKVIIEAELAKVLEGEFRNQGMAVT